MGTVLSFFLALAIEVVVGRRVEDMLEEEMEEVWQQVGSTGGAVIQGVGRVGAKQSVGGQQF